MAFTNKKQMKEFGEKLNKETEGKNGIVSEFEWHDRKHIGWFPIGLTSYSIKGGKIFVNKGLFNTVSNQTRLYRITDMQMRRTFLQKVLFHTGTLILVSKVDADHEIKFENIKHPELLNDTLSDLIEADRRKNNVLGKEFYSPGCGMDFGHGGPGGPNPMADADGDGIPDYMDDHFDGVPDHTTEES